MRYAGIIEIGISQVEARNGRLLIVSIKGLMRSWTFYNFRLRTLEDSFTSAKGACRCIRDESQDEEGSKKALLRNADWRS